MWPGGPMLEGLFLLVVGQFIPVQRSPSLESTAKMWFKAQEEFQIHPPIPMLKNIPKPSNSKYPQKFSTIPSLIPQPSPNTFNARPALVSPIPKPRNSPVVTSQKLQPVASSSRRREDQSPLLLSAAHVFQKREHGPITATIQDQNMENDVQDAVYRFCRRAYRNSREVITYSNDRMIPGTASEEMAAKFACYEDELINDI
ncbi:hypothetical protein O181_114277 [Austropuccinia psidii MF-1]|uniref:Uncharacterized protein n=1 Tax=Austropuccinia psidii MF-1 TaxID=1389203 RepID=A0A9Q3K790_9BASI|nr:hypothetical protein [Austropuccinia psidii MF-1]